MIKKYFALLVFSLLIINTSYSKESFYEQAKELFEKEKYEESKFLFQRDIVFNPKQAKSYLYLAKIFKKESNLKEQENNLNSAILLDPKNEEAMYILIDLELERSNFSKVQDLKKDFKKICNTLCEKLTSIDTRLKDFEKKDAS